MADADNVAVKPSGWDTVREIAAVWGDDKGTADRLAQNREQWQQQQRRIQIAPLSQQLSADRLRLAAYVDPKTLKPLAGHEQDYETTLDRMAQTIGQMRTAMGAKAPSEDPSSLKTAAARLLDATHITRDLQNHLRTAQSGKVNDWYAQNREQAAAERAGMEPFDLTPEGQRMAYQRDTEIKVAQARLEAAGWTKNGSPVKVGDKWMQPFVNKMGETMMQPMPEGYSGPNAKPIKGTLVRSTQSPTGFAQTYVDPMDPNKVVAWQPVTPSRYYEGTQTTSTSKDSLGVVTSSTRTTNPLNGGTVDLSRLPQFDDNGDSAPAAAQPSSSSAPAPAAQSTPPAGPKTQQLHQVRARTPQQSGPKKLDANGNIPENAGNPGLVAAANELIQGKAQKDLKVPTKDLPAVVALARQYGYLGEGMWTPQERMQVDQSQVQIDKIRNDKQLMSVFGEGAAKRALVQTAIEKSKTSGFRANLERSLLNLGLSKTDVAFIQDYQNLVGRIQGLARLTRGSGRPTEAAVGRMLQELPNLLTAQSPEEAQNAFDQIQDEIDIGLGKKQGGAKTQQLRQTQQNGAVSDDDILNGLNKLAGGH